MAHVKVVRRSMDKEEWITLRASWLSRHVIKKNVAVEGWQIKEARQIGEMEYEFYDKEYRSIKNGEMFFSPDGTSFFRVEVCIPEEFEKEEVWFQFKTAAEMMIKINGKWAGGVDPNRNKILVSACCKKNEKFCIEMEGYNRSKPDDERNPQASPLRGCRQVFNGGAFVVLNKEVEQAIYDVNVLMETMNSEYVKEEIREFIKLELDKALNIVDYEEEDEDIYLRDIKELRKYLKEKVFENKSYGKLGKIALVAHSHLDIAYYWRRIHTIQKNARTCLIQLRLMEQYPDFKYCHSQAYTYEMLEKYYPEIFEEIKEKVEEGRFELAGGMYVEPDCNIPTAESLIRQCMYGQHYFRSRFNKTVENCWLPDVFGNSWILPQILQKSGIKYFVSNKMSTWNDTNKFPHNHFIWRGIDGSEVYACVPPTHFISWNTPEQIMENWESFQDKDACDESLNMFGYGDGGSGATEEMIEYMKRIENVPGMPQIRHIRGDEFLKESLENNKALKVWDGELYLEMHRGTFTTKGFIKKWNRQLEILLRDAEMLCTFASFKGNPYPKEKMTECWKKVLLNQFHDILPGTHIAPVAKDTKMDYEEVFALLQQIIEETLQSLRAGASSGKANAYTLINTLGWDRTGPVFIKGEFALEEGVKEFLSQRGTYREEEGLWIQVDKIPALGAKSICIEKMQAEESNWFDFKNNHLETPYYKAVFETDGSLSSLVVKAEGRELVAPNSIVNKIRIYKDNPGMYDAWDILDSYKEREDGYEVNEKISIEEKGTMYVTFKVQLKLKNSEWTQKIRFYRNNEKIEFEHVVDWQETNRLAKAEFNLNLLARHAKCDTSAGTIIRDTHKNTSWQKARFEVCSHKWADLSEYEYGVAILNDCKYGISFDENQIGLTLLKSSIRPDLNSDKGVHTFSYALLPHKDSAEKAGVIEEAWKFNTPLQIVPALEINEESLIKLSSNTIHIQAIKRPEEENKKNSFIIRLVELKGQRGKCSLILNKPINNVSKLNLLEDIIKDRDFTFEECTLYFNYKPFEILTFEMEL